MTWDYIAGFVDGEGSVVKRRWTYSLRISQTNREVLESIKEFAGRGHVYSIKKRKSHWKDAWLYSAGGNDDTQYVLSHIVEKLIVKRNQALRVLMDIEKWHSDIRAREKLQRERIKQARTLRAKGWSYRKIGKELNTDWGYARRLILFSK